MTVNDHFIYNYDDPVIKEALAKRNLNVKLTPYPYFKNMGGFLA